MFGLPLAALRGVQLRRKTIAACAIVAALAANPPKVAGYSVLSHEAAIDAAWDASIRPLLLARFPSTSAAALDRARSFAYGGSVIQDLGYYPFGNKFFSNLLHYARSGDFVEALLGGARDVDELAFAIGALAHFTNDNTGHPEAVNRSVPLVFPKLQAKFGDAVTYEQAPKQHVIVEFSFDVAHTARAVYPLSAYRNFIGFRVAVPLLEQAFRETYALELADLFPNRDRAVSTYRYAVSQVLPALTEAAWRDKQEEIAKLTAGASRDAFVLVYGRIEFERDFGKDYQKPALFARFLAFLYRFVPKIGPLKPLTFKLPTPEADGLFTRSITDANARFRRALADLRGGNVDLRNTNFDTGRSSRRGDYALADETYDALVERLSKRRFEGVTAALRRNVISFYGADSAPSQGSRKERKEWERVQRNLAALSAAQNAPPAPNRSR